MISKELLSVVFDKEITEVEYCETCKSKILDLVIPESIVFRTKDNKYGMWRNVHDVANECKKWAYSQGYVLFSKIRLNSSLASCYFDVMGKHDYEDDYHNDFRAETEPEAIFKACQWILTKDSK